MYSVNIIFSQCAQSSDGHDEGIVWRLDVKHLEYVKTIFRSVYDIVSIKSSGVISSQHVVTGDSRDEEGVRRGVKKRKKSIVNNIFCDITFNMDNSNNNNSPVLKISVIDDQQSVLMVSTVSEPTIYCIDDCTDRRKYPDGTVLRVDLRAICRILGSHASRTVKKAEIVVDRTRNELVVNVENKSNVKVVHRIILFDVNDINGSSRYICANMSSIGLTLDNVFDVIGTYDKYVDVSHKSLGVFINVVSRYHSMSLFKVELKCVDDTGGDDCVMITSNDDVIASTEVCISDGIDKDDDNDNSDLKQHMFDRLSDNVYQTSSLVKMRKLLNNCSSCSLMLRSSHVSKEERVPIVFRLKYEGVMTFMMIMSFSTDCTPSSPSRSFTLTNANTISGDDDDGDGDDDSWAGEVWI